jgi:hypothetical protein
VLVKPLTVTYCNHQKSREAISGTSHGFQKSQHYHVLPFPFFVKEQLFETGLMKTRRLPSMQNHKLSKNPNTEKIFLVLQ